MLMKFAALVHSAHSPVVAIFESHILGRSQLSAISSSLTPSSAGGVLEGCVSTTFSALLIVYLLCLGAWSLF